MQFLLASTALLALFKPHHAAGLAIESRADVKHVTLNVVNTQLAPDGFSRSTIKNLLPSPKLTLAHYRYYNGERDVSHALNLDASCSLRAKTAIPLLLSLLPRVKRYP